MMIIVLAGYRTLHLDFLLTRLYEFQLAKLRKSCSTYNCRSWSLSIPQICGSYQEGEDKTGEEGLHCSGHLLVAPVRLVLSDEGANQIGGIQVSG